MLISTQAAVYVSSHCPHLSTNALSRAYSLAQQLLAAIKARARHFAMQISSYRSGGCSRGLALRPQRRSCRRSGYQCHAGMGDLYKNVMKNVQNLKVKKGDTEATFAPLDAESEGVAVP